METYRIQSLDNLKEWLHDCIDADVPPSTISYAIKEVLDEQETELQKKLNTVRSLRSLLQQDNRSNINFCESTNTSDYCKNSWNDFWGYDPGGNDSSDTITFGEQRWVVPVEVDDTNGEYFITFTEDILQKLGWKEGDDLEFIDSENGSFTIKNLTTKTTPTGETNGTI
jgi:hypothetical protein